MTSAVRKQPTFGRRGNGPPQKSRIVASVPVTQLGAPSAKTPDKKKSVPKASRIWTAPAAFLKACAAASASAFATLGVASAAAVQNGKSAVADFRAARAVAKAQAEATKLSRAQAVERADARRQSAGSVPASNTVLLPTLPEFDFVAELVATDPAPQAEAVASAETFVEPEPALQDFGPEVAEIVPAPQALHQVSNVDASEIVAEEPSGSRPAQSLDVGTTPAVPASNTVLLPTLPEFDFVAELVATDPAPQAEAVASAETFVEPESAPQELRSGVAEIVPAPTALHLVSIVETSEIVAEEPESADGLDLPELPFKANLDEAAVRAPAAFLIAEADRTDVDEAVLEQGVESPSAVQAFEDKLYAGNGFGSAGAFEQPGVVVQEFETELDAANASVLAALPEQTIESHLHEPAISRDADVLPLDAPGTWTTPAVALGTSVVAFPAKLPPPEDFTDEPSTQYELFAMEGEASSVAHVDTADDWIWGRAYFLACAVAFPVAVGLMCKFGGPTGPMTGLGPVAQVFVAAVSPLLGLVFFLPAVGLVQLARLVRIPRGFRDVLTGGLLGSSWLLLALNDGLTPPLAAYCLLAAGLLGGLIFWLANRRTS